MTVFLAAVAAMSCLALPVLCKEVVSLRAETAFNGQWTAETEKIFDKKLAHYNSSTQFWGAINYALFRTGKKGVLIGEDGWLFTTEEFAGSGNIKPRMDQIFATRDKLKAQNIDLAVILLPAKARIYGEHLGNHILPAYKAPLYKKTIAELKRENIKAVDLLSIFESHKTNTPLFLRTDTHWTTQGAQLAAQETAQALGTLSYQKKSFTSETRTPIEHEGDLMRYVPTGPWQAIEPDRLAAVTTTESAATENVSENSLFGDASIPIALVGTSYSANKLWNFEGFLKETLQTDVLNAADEGLGPFETMEKYLVNEAFLNAPPKLVLWEIPERYLTLDPEKR